GNTLQSNVESINTDSGTGFPNNSYTSIGSAATTVAWQSWAQYTPPSFFGRLDYNYAGKYFLEASARADGSSKFGANNKWGYFPSIGASWRIKQEAFLQDWT